MTKLSKAIPLNSGAKQKLVELGFAIEGARGAAVAATGYYQSLIEQRQRLIEAMLIAMGLDPRDSYHVDPEAGVIELRRDTDGEHSEEA